ncbi:MAG: DHH family phosphoesterase [Nanoarchaeota archaeon]|nr:DHH family phosphoesterase [Nanoarchaeota archaeon]
MDNQKSLNIEIKNLAEKFTKSDNKEILLISHHDTDGITSAVIMIETLKELDRKFSVKIIKSLEEEFIMSLPKEKIIIFLDLASGSLEQIRKVGIKDIFIIDHHEITQEIPKGINIINPELFGKEKISGSSLTYLFCKELTGNVKKLAKFAVLGMIGDTIEKEIDKLNNGILEEGEIKRKRGVLIYPSTRPLNRTLEFCSRPYIPGVSGNIKGVLELLREIGMTPKEGKYKSIMELNDEEMEKLATAIILRNPKAKNREMIGDIFLIKHFNKLEDARELSAIINACSRLGKSHIALQFCMEIPKAKKIAEEIYVKYKQLIISGLKFVSECEKINGEKFMIINAGDKIKDTIIGTIASILSYSSIYEDETIIVTMAYFKDKIKVSARNVGKKGRNVREVLSRVVDETGGEIGGHEFAAGCIIKQEKEKEFIKLLKKNLEIEVVRV